MPVKLSIVSLSHGLAALVKRSFPPPRNTRPVDAGYRDAPDAQSDVAIVHMKVDRPKEVSTAEVTVAEKPDDAAALKTLAAYSAGVARAVKVVRSMLPVYNGYECKETEAGRLTLAFRYVYLFCGALLRNMSHSTVILFARQVP